MTWKHKSCYRIKITMDFYYSPIKPPCRAVMLTAKAVRKELNLKKINLAAGDQLKSEFIKINPLHTVPTLVDGDFVLWESRAICSYLASKYGKDDSLYPKDPRKRADVDRYLYFDLGTLDLHAQAYFVPVFLGQKPDPEKLEKLMETLGTLNGFLEGKLYITGDNVTVADHSIVAMVSSLVDSGIDISNLKNILPWLEACKMFPGYNEVNAPGSEEFGKVIKSKLAALQ